MFLPGILSHLHMNKKLASSEVKLANCGRHKLAVADVS